jgi:pimeloyl-ACP methyl ester carboxylesterase
MSLHFEIHGTGTPVIFLHGFMESSSMWQELVKRLPVKAICIDMPGHGKSADFQNEPITIHHVAEKVWQLVLKNNWQQAQIVGHSMGGYVALELMKNHPEFEHIYLLHSHPWSDSETKQKDRDRVIELVQDKSAIFIQEAIPNLFWQKNLADAINSYKQVALTMTPSAIAHAAQAMRDRLDNSEVVLKHKDRFTFIQGRYDSLIPKMDVLSFCLNNGINYIELSHSGHMGQVEELETLSAILGELLSL